MSNSTISQLKKRIAQLNRLIAKFPRSRSLVRKWGFELVVLEGKLEDLTAPKAEAKPAQLRVRDMTTYSREDAASLIKQHLEGIEKEQYQVNIWLKEGRVRLYVKDLAFRNAKDKGFFAFNTDGTAFYDGLSGSGSGQIADEIRKILKDIKVLPDKEAKQKILSSKKAYKEAMTDPNTGLPRRLNQEEVEEILRQPKILSTNSTEWCFGAADEESF